MSSSWQCHRLPRILWLELVLPTLFLKVLGILGRGGQTFPGIHRQLLLLEPGLWAGQYPVLFLGLLQAPCTALLQLLVPLGDWVPPILGGLLCVCCHWDGSVPWQSPVL
jgi:hypothetical protein